MAGQHQKHQKKPCSPSAAQEAHELDVVGGDDLERRGREHAQQPNAVWEDAARHGCAAVCMALSAQQPRHRRSSLAAGSNLCQRTSCHAEALPPGQPPTHSPATRSPPSSPPASPIPIRCNLPAAMHALPPKSQPPTHLHLLHQGGQVHRLALGGRGSRLRQGRLRRQGGSLAEGRCMRARSVSSWESVQRCKQGDLHLQLGECQSQPCTPGSGCRWGGGAAASPHPRPAPPPLSPALLEGEDGWEQLRLRCRCTCNARLACKVQQLRRHLANDLAALSKQASSQALARPHTWLLRILMHLGVTKLQVRRAAPLHQAGGSTGIVSQCC